MRKARSSDGHDGSSPDKGKSPLEKPEAATPHEAGDDAPAESLQERLNRSEAERAQLELRLEHEEQSARRILEAHDATEGRLAELEGVLTGTEAVRARAESERDELERRLTVELAERQQQHQEQRAAAAGRIAVLEQALLEQERKAERERAEYERERAADSLRIAGLQRGVAGAQEQASRRVQELEEDIRPRSARRLTEMRAELDSEREARSELELRLAELAEARQILEDTLAWESETARDRIDELEVALEEARSGWKLAQTKLAAAGESVAAADAARSELERERDDAIARVAKQEGSGERLHELELALESLSADRNGLETARRELEARLSTREEAEHAWLAELEAQRRTARSQRLQLTRVERRMTEIAGGLGIAMRRLEAPLGQDHEVTATTTASPGGDRTLASGFLRSAETFPRRPALEVAGVTHEFADLRDRAARIAATLQREAPETDPPLTAVFAHRSATAFAGLLGALMRGHGYVPLDRTLPVARTRALFEQAGSRTIIADSESAVQLAELLSATAEPVVVLLPDLDDATDLRRALPAHRVLAAGDLEPAGSWQPATVDPSAIACLLFTAAGTGAPGVMVAHRNALHHVDTLVERYGVDEQDRFSQVHDLTVGNSLFDLFGAWERGACVCCPGQPSLVNPGSFIRGSQLTVWLSVPSVATAMRRLGALTPDSFPSLRWSLFAGEPLPAEVVRAWEQAAPASTIENLYGPSESTAGVTLYRWDPASSLPECERGVLPIGRPLPDTGVLVVDEQLGEVAPGDEGELLVSGPQVTLGYWRDPQRTAAAYVTPPGHDALHFRTGDLARRPAGPEDPIVLRGRRDE